MARALILIAIFVGPFWSHACLAEIRIVSWNIGNLASGPDVPLRGQSRTVEDYEYLRSKLTEIDPDVVALQEIGSIPAAQQILGDDYSVLFETRCLVNASRCMTDSGGIYTAIAYRTDLEAVDGTFQIDELSINHTDECGETRKVRGGVGVKLNLQGRSVWIPSIHMKSACKDNEVETDTEDDCATQQKQFEVLADWITERPEGDAVILAGDFNRKLLTKGDKVRREIFEMKVPGAQFLPTTEARSCWKDVKFDFVSLRALALQTNTQFRDEGMTPWIYNPASNSSVDFFIIIDPSTQLHLEALQAQSTEDVRIEPPFESIYFCDGKIKPFDETRAWAFGKVFPSDHCPIVLDVQ